MNLKGFFSTKYRSEHLKRVFGNLLGSWEIDLFWRTLVGTRSRKLTRILCCRVRHTAKPYLFIRPRSKKSVCGDNIVPGTESLFHRVLVCEPASVRRARNLRLNDGPLAIKAKSMLMLMDACRCHRIGLDEKESVSQDNNPSRRNLLFALLQMYAKQNRTKSYRRSLFYLYSLIKNGRGAASCYCIYARGECNSLQLPLGTYCADFLCDCATESVKSRHDRPK